MLANTGRLLTRLDRAPEAVHVFGAIQSPGLRAQAGLALAHCRAGDYQVGSSHV